MDRDREYARIVRESGLVPAEKVRASLRRVALMKARGLDTDLLRDLILQDLIDEATAESVRGELDDQKKKRVTTKRIRAEDRARPADADAIAPGNASSSHVALASGEHFGTPAPLPGQSPSPTATKAAAKSAARPVSNRAPAPSPAAVLPAQVWAQVQEQARILQLAALVTTDQLRESFRQIAAAYQRGEDADLLAILVADGTITDAHEKAVRLKMRRDAGNPKHSHRPKVSDRRRPVRQTPAAPAPPPPSAVPTPATSPGAREGNGTNPPHAPAHASPPLAPVLGASDALDRPLNLAALDEIESIDNLTIPAASPPPSSGNSLPTKGAGDSAFFDQAVVRARPENESPPISAYESAPDLPSLPPLLARGHDRALGMMISESGLVNRHQMEEAKRRIDAARRVGRQTDLSRELVALGYLSWEDLAPFVGKLLGEHRAAEIHQKMAHHPAAEPSSAAAIFPPAAPPPSRPGTGIRRAPASPIGVPGEMQRTQLPAPVEHKTGAPAPVPPPPPDGPKPVHLRDLSMRPAAEKPRDFKPKAVRAKTPKRRPQAAPKNTLQVQAVPALPPTMGGIEPSPPIEIERNRAPVAELMGDIGEYRLSITNALGVAATIDLREPDDIARDAVAESALKTAEGLRAPGADVPAIERFTDSRSKYQILGEIARGGMGTVIRALDRDVRRDVAMKILDDNSDRERLTRFLEEAQITGQLEHPNIVPIHDVGLDRHGRLFFTMKLVKGESLAEILAQIERREKQGSSFAYKDFTLHRLLDVFVKVCHAVAFAHSKGVIHRDLKPENVMVGEYGEVQVMDWGIAKILPRPDVEALQGAARRPTADKVRQSRRSSGRLARVPSGIREGSSSSSRTRVVTDRSEDDALQSHVGDVTGTPQYMPPEQAQGQVDKLDERTDIYSLGAILYEILTLKPPFEADSVLVILRAVVHEPLTVPSERTPERSVPHELDAIAKRAMEKHPKDRYQTVAELQADVQAFLEGGRVASVEYSPMQLLRKWVMRHRAVVGAIGMAVALALVAGVFGYLQAANQRDAAHRRAENAIAAAMDAATGQANAKRDAETLAAENAELTGERRAIRDASRHAQLELATVRIAEGRYVEAAAGLKTLAADWPADPHIAAFAAHAAALAHPVEPARTVGARRIVAVSPVLDRWLVEVGPQEIALVDAATSAVVSQANVPHVVPFAVAWSRAAVSADFSRIAAPSHPGRAIQQPFVLMLSPRDGLSVVPISVAGIVTGICFGPSNAAYFTEVSPTHGARIGKIDAATNAVSYLATWPDAAPDGLRALGVTADESALLLADPHGGACGFDIGNRRWLPAGDEFRDEITTPHAAPIRVASGAHGLLVGTSAGVAILDPLRPGSVRRMALPLSAAVKQVLAVDAEFPRVIAVAADGEIFECAADSGRVLSRTKLPVDPGFVGVQGLADGARVVVADFTSASVVRLDRRFAPLVRRRFAAAPLAVHPLTAHLATIADSHTVEIVDVATATVRAVAAPVEMGADAAVSWVPNAAGEWLLRAGNRLFHLDANGRVLREFALDAGDAGPWMISGDPAHFFVHRAGRIVQIELATAAVRAVVPLPDAAAVWCVAIAEWPTRLFCVRPNGQVLAVDVATGSPRLEWLKALPMPGVPAATPSIEAVAAPDFASTGAWKFSRSAPLPWPKTVASTADGRPLVVGIPGTDSLVVAEHRDVWFGSMDGGRVGLLRRFDAAVTDLKLAPAGDFLLVAWADGSVIAVALAPLVAAIAGPTDSESR